MRSSFWNKLTNYTVTSCTYNYKKITLKTFERVEHNFRHNFYQYYHY